MRIAISRVHFPVTTLGSRPAAGNLVPGLLHPLPRLHLRRYVGGGRGGLELAELFGRIEGWLEQAEGITISGGEPFDQADALGALLHGLRERMAADILVYSGYALERLARPLADLEGLIDALITDPFVLDAPQTLPIRGSDNQRLHRLTALGRSRFADYDEPAPRRRGFRCHV